MHQSLPCSFHRYMFRSVRLVAVWTMLITGLLTGQTADVTAAVDLKTIINPRSTLLLGITFDARSGMRGNSGPIGYHDTSGAMLPGIVPLFGDFPMSTLRYPANAVSFGFNWKWSVGPAALRPAQNIVGIGPAQPMKFGFDEFMAMTAARGAQPKDVQIMLTIYTKGTPGLTQLQAAAAIDDAALSAADWVEYANGTDSSVNTGGGVNWTAERMKNGHPAPYGIRIWNLGNEPWGSGEFGNDTAAANKYAAMVRPIIDSMLTRDPSIQITIPSTGPATSQWNTTLMNHPLLKGKVYGISPHFFPEETSVNGTIPLGVAKVEGALPALIDSAAARGWKVIVGDHAHGIPTANGVPVGDPNLAMQWQGANLTADFLLMVSQQRTIERANFWAYGLPQGTWHPIRLNGPGSYTLMPAGMIYKKFFPLFLDRSVSVKTVSPKGSDGNAYSVRTGAFISADTSLVTVIAVNRDKQDSHILSLSGVAGYSMTGAALMTGASLTADVIDEQSAVPSPSGTFTLPPMSVLAVRYKKNAVAHTASAAEIPTKFEVLQNYPNPFNPSTTIQYSLSSGGTVSLIVYDCIGRVIAAVKNEYQSAGTYTERFDASQLPSGIYISELRCGTSVQYLRMVLIK